MLDKRVRGIVAEQLNSSEQWISYDECLKEDLQVSDIELVQIVLALEDEFKISINKSDVKNFFTVGDIVKYLKGRGVKDYPKFENLLKQRFGVENLKEINDPLKKMYIDFALSTISRGEAVKKYISEFIDVNGKRYLDVGCAYGGFLVAFSMGGAKQTVGIDIDEYLLDYSRALAEDCGVNPMILKKDILDITGISELGRFDIITCYDVIEHVDNPRIALENMVYLLEEQGLLYLQIPNRMCANFIKSDGHFQLFGITILPKNLADEYYNQLFPNKKHDVTYKSLNYYIDNLNKLGLVCEVLQPYFLDIDAKLHEIFETLEECVDICKSGCLSNISFSLQKEIQDRILNLYDFYKQQYNNYLNFKYSDSKKAEELGSNLLMTFGCDFWSITARRYK